MMNTTHFPIFLWCAICTVIACSGNEKPAATVTEDTRILVKQAYDSIDYSKVAVIFNEKRAADIKKKLDQETDPAKRTNLSLDYALELLRAGETKEALENFAKLTKYLGENKIPLDPFVKRQLYSYIGITFLRHGEIENCVMNHNHESCILPIDGNAIHDLTFGSEGAIKQFEASLAEFPDDLETRYLLNLAYMTLGKFPDGVPAQYRFKPEWFESKVKIQEFMDVAGKLGVNRRSHAGGSLVEDFNNDGWLDILTSSWGPEDELILYINNGNGTFTDKTAEYNLTGHKASLQISKADFNNDGWVDVLMLRGAWYQEEGDMPRTLLMNNGGKFTDVTIKAGLTKYAATQAAAWADFNLDGYVDLIIANESKPGYDRGIDLYMNQQDGTFKHESTAYGLTMNNYFKGVVASDVNNDRYPDIYLTSLAEGNYLFLNTANGNARKFVPAAPSVAVGQPMRSFPCWAFDYNNDGNEDLFASSYDNSDTPVSYWVNSKLGKADKAFLPKLYANLGNMQFEEVGQALGLDEVAFTMGCNFGDINADGFLDFFLSTGNPSYSSLVPNKMYLNIEGKRFEDVSYSGGFANIQKGHGSSFGDLDHDGDEDLYVVIGGAYDGDFYYNSLFENPNQEQNNWLILNLEGTTANKKAIGARVAITLEERGKQRMVHRTVTNGASFGGNSFALEIGLRKADKVKEVKVQWPCASCPEQVFTDLAINKAYKLTEGQAAPVVMTYDKVRFGSSGHAEHVQ